MDGGTTLNQSNDLIMKAWINLFICITTNDVNEFYKALSGYELRDGQKKHYTWDVATNARPINIRKDDKRLK